MFLVPLSTMETRNDPIEQDEKMHTSFWITWQQVQMRWSDFTLPTFFYAQIPMHHI